MRECVKRGIVSDTYTVYISANYIATNLQCNFYDQMFAWRILPQDISYIFITQAILSTALLAAGNNFDVVRVNEVVVPANVVKHSTRWWNPEHRCMLGEL